jgi:hypothetical protein
MVGCAAFTKADCHAGVYTRNAPSMLTDLVAVRYWRY